MRKERDLLPDHGMEHSLLITLFNARKEERGLVREKLKEEWLKSRTVH